MGQYVITIFPGRDPGATAIMEALLDLVGSDAETYTMAERGTHFLDGSTGLSLRETA